MGGQAPRTHPPSDELGGVVVKAGLVELIEDDRAALYGAFLSIAEKVRGEERDNALALWKRKGKRAFEAESEAAAEKRSFESSG